MDSVSIAESIKTFAAEDCIVTADHKVSQPWIEIEPTYLLKVCAELKNRQELEFDFLSCLSGVDYPDSGKIGVVYHLFSLVHEHQIVLKCFVPRNTIVASTKSQDQKNPGLPLLPSVSQIWPSAIWHEREVFDLFGIWFENHPDLRRILLPDDWEGYPLRKDYVLQEDYHQIKTSY